MSLWRATETKTHYRSAYRARHVGGTGGQSGRLFRSSEALALKKKAKPGRPRLPKGEAKGRIVPVRFAPDVLKAMEAAARDEEQSLSGWIRSTINAALNGKRR